MADFGLNCNGIVSADIKRGALYKVPKNGLLGGSMHDIMANAFKFPNAIKYAKPGDYIVNPDAFTAVTGNKTPDIQSVMNRYGVDLETIKTTNALQYIGGLEGQSIKQAPFSQLVIPANAICKAK